MYFSENSAQVLQSNSAAQSGSGWLLELVEVRAVHERPVDQHREPAVGREAARIRFSDSRSVIE